MRHFESDVVTASALLWQIAMVCPGSRQRRAPACFKQKLQLAFETAQSDCIVETAEKFDLKDGDTSGDPAAISEELYRMLDYFTFGSKNRLLVAPRAEVMSAFQDCFKAKAAAVTAEKSSKNKADDFDKTYMKDGILVLLDTVNRGNCKSKFAAVDVLDEKYVEQVRQKWKKLGPIRRAFKWILVKVAGWFNRGLVDCFTKDKTKDARLPLLMCPAAPDKELQAIFQKCIDDNILPAARKELAKKAEQPDKKTVQLGERWKAFINAWVCDEKNLRSKRSLTGAGKIIVTWPVSVLVGVFEAAGVIIFMTIGGGVISAMASLGFATPFGLIAGGFMGAVAAVCLLLYCIIGVPMRALVQLFNHDTSADDYDHTQAIADVSSIPKKFMGM